MNLTLWIIQGLLAFVFAASGALKVTQPREKLAKQTPYVEDFSPRILKWIGVLEVLGAVGLLIPLASGIQPWLTTLAAAGLGLTMIGAMATHLRRTEYPNLALNVVLFLLAITIVLGRGNLLFV